ncbi:MAG TPA: hypothetical protein VM513_28275 [Kofleriaceae bacterium]|nr:hypothetical protein [Kofleriaceae bacterium]
MPQQPPPLGPEQVAYLEAAASILVGTSTAELQPEVVRGVAVRALPGGERVQVFVPAALAQRTLANVAATSRLAVTTAGVPTYNTIQLKGRVAAVRDATDAERDLAATYRHGFAAEFAWAGAIVGQRAVGVWPCKVFELAIEMIYIEAPAPLDFPAERPRP